MNADRMLAHYERIADAPDTVPRLRRFVLDLAVRGKLVDQDPNEEPAAELLKRIAKEKARLVKARESRREKSLPEIESDDVPYEIPYGWEWTRIREITSNRGQTVPDCDFTYIDVTAINKEIGCIEGAKVISASEAPSRARKIVRKGDVLYSCVRPYLLNIAIVEREISPVPIASTAFAVLNGFELVLPRYQWIVLRSPVMVTSVEEKMRGQAYPAINDSDFALLLFPLPPLAEQHRIVAKVDELMALCDRLEVARIEREAMRDRLSASSLARLDAPDPDPMVFRNHAAFALEYLTPLTTRRDQIKALRQTILNLAVRGKLMAQNPNDESASELLKRIAADRVRLEKTGSIKRSKPLPPVDTTDAPFNLPAGWAWARFPEVGTFGRGKSKHRPRNDPILYNDGKYPFIQTGDIARSGGLVETYSSLYNDAGLAQSTMWPAHTLCITIAANIADSGILAFDACFPDSVVGLITHDSISARFFEYFIRTAKGDLHEFAPSTAQKNINLGILTEVLIPLPPLAEQHRIVARVDELMALCDRLETSLTTSDNTRSRLLGALLIEALEPGGSHTSEQAERAAAHG